MKKKIEKILEKYKNTPLNQINKEIYSILTREIEKKLIYQKNLFFNSYNELTTAYNSAILITNSEGRVINVNSIFCNYFSIDISPDELINLEISEVFMEARNILHDAKTTIKYIEAIRKNKVSELLVIPFADGHEIYSYNSYLDLDEDIFVWIFKDYRLQNQFFAHESFINSDLHDGMFELDLTNSKVTFSKNLLHILHLNREEYEYDIFRNFLTLDKFMYFTHAIEEHLLGNKNFNEIFDFKLFDGKKWYNIKGKTLFNETHDAIRFIGALHDISIFKEKVSKLQHLERSMHTFQKQKDYFNSMITHELKTPLNSIIGYANILHSNPSISNLEKQQVKIIKEDSESLLAKLNNIFKVSKIESGKEKINSVSFRSHDLIDELTKVFKKPAKNKGNKFILEIDPEIPRSFKGDFTKLRVAISNLLDNAIKYTQNGQIIFSIQRLENLYRFSVSDTGIGIPQEQIIEILYPFNKVLKDNTDSGTGLGLSIVNSYVNIMGGQLEIESNEGKGSEFYFVIALEEIHSPFFQKDSNKKIISGIKSQNPVRILLATENEAFSEIWSEKFSQLSFTSETANDGYEALIIAHNFIPDILIIKKDIPVINGEEVIKMLLQKKRDNPFLIFIITKTDKERIDPKLSKIGANIITEETDFYDLLEEIPKYIPIEYEFEEQSKELEILHPQDFDFIALSKIIQKETYDELNELVLIGDLSGVKNVVEKCGNSELIKSLIHYLDQFDLDTVEFIMEKLEEHYN